MTAQAGAWYMLVSARADGELRREVANGLRPRPEYLVLEQRHGVTLIDWSSLAGGGRERSLAGSIRHVIASLPRLRNADAVLTDGEHVGVPLALALWARRERPAHVMIGHHLLSASKKPFFRLLGVQKSIDRIVVHSKNQMTPIARELGVERSRLVLVPYGVDLEFWSPEGESDASIVAAPGREHRDFETLAAALHGDDVRVHVTATSPHSPHASKRAPVSWPRNFEVGALRIADLRAVYRRAAVVVVPLLHTDFPAGVTTVLEAMAMGKPVVVSDTEGLRGLVDDGETGLVVPVGDSARLREAVRALLKSPDERSRLGRRARQAAVERFGVDRYAERLAELLREQAASRGA